MVSDLARLRRGQEQDVRVQPGQSARTAGAGECASNVALDFNYPATLPDFGRVGQIWQADLDKIGVKLTLKPTDPVALTNSMQRQQYNGVAVGTGFYGQLHGGVVWTSPYFGPVNNYAGFKDDKYTQLTLAVYSEADPSKRKPVYDAWNDFILDQTPVTAIVDAIAARGGAAESARHHVQHRRQLPGPHWRLAGMSIVDAFPHIIPADCLERFFAVANGPALDFLRGLRGRAYLAPMWDLDARFRSMDAVEGYVQVLTLCLPPIEQMAAASKPPTWPGWRTTAWPSWCGAPRSFRRASPLRCPWMTPTPPCLELDRAVEDLGALGVQVFTNCNGAAMDDPRYEPLWERLEALDRTVWVHGARQPTTRLRRRGPLALRAVGGARLAVRDGHVCRAHGRLGCAGPSPAPAVLSASQWRHDADVQSPRERFLARAPGGRAGGRARVRGFATPTRRVLPAVLR